MLLEDKNVVLTTEEAIRFLRISKPTFLKYVRVGRIRAVKAGNGYRVLYPELLRFLNTPVEKPGIEALNKPEKPLTRTIRGLEDPV